MGRGRAKAKQTRVARQLKYSSQHLDIERLRADLGVDSQHDDMPSTAAAQENEPEHAP